MNKLGINHNRNHCKNLEISYQIINLIYITLKKSSPFTCKRDKGQFYLPLSISMELWTFNNDMLFSTFNTYLI